MEYPDFNLVLVDNNCEIAEKGNLAMTIDEKVQDTYHCDEIPEEHRTITLMLMEAFRAGEKSRSEEILKLLGSK